MRRSGSGYPTAILISLLLHGGVIALLVSGWHPEFKPRQLPQSTYMEAALLQMDAPPSPPGRKQAKPAPPSPPRPDPAEIQRQQQAARDKAAAAQAAKEQAAAKAAQQKAAQQKVAQEKAAAEKAAAEKVAREKMAREKVAADKAAAEKAAKEKAAKEKAAKEQAAKDKAAREQAAREKAARDKAAQEKAAQAKAAAEQAARDKAAAEQAAAVQGQMIATYGDYVRDRIISNWNRPPSARRDMEAVLQVRLVPTGQVMGVSVIRSSGDPAFDQSAVNAVQQVGRFERLQELSRKDPLLFERTFRTLTLTFRPEDLRL
ncbi:MAG: cell envelope integrity protein TolA [Pseudomonadales bacterium]|nr:cell envelope integrity protein TolA [Pseudomonadales bacterium]